MAERWIKIASQSWDQVKAGYDFLLTIAPRIEPYAEDLNNLQYLVEYIKTDITTHEARPDKGIDDWENDKNCIAMLDLELVESLRVTPDSFDKTVLDDIATQLKIIVAGIGSPVAIPLYSLGEMKAIVSGINKTYDEQQYITTLREWLYDDEDVHDFIKFVLEFWLEKPPEFNNISWQSLFEYQLIFNVIIRRFDRLHPKFQDIILKYFYYRLISLGLPIREKMRQYLALTSSTYTYVLRTKELFGGIENNVEMISVYWAGEDDLVERRLFDVLGEIKLLAESERTKYYDATYPTEKNNSAALRSILSEAFDIYDKLSQATMIDWFKERLEGTADIVDDTLIKLVISFGFGGAYEFVLEYYKGNQTPDVPFIKFITTLSEIVNVSEEKNIENVLKFQEILKENSLLSSDVDLIIFNESTSQFEWNPSVLK